MHVSLDVPLRRTEESAEYSVVSSVLCVCWQRMDTGILLDEYVN